MKARELLERLQTLDEKSLDLDVLLTDAPPNEVGGFCSVGGVSVKYVGHVVLHIGITGQDGKMKYRFIEELTRNR